MAYNDVGRNGILCISHDVPETLPAGELPFLFNRRNRHNLTYLNFCSITIEIVKIKPYHFVQPQKLMFEQLAIRVGLMGLDKLRKSNFQLM